VTAWILFRILSCRPTLSLQLILRDRPRRLASIDFLRRPECCIRRKLARTSIRSQLSAWRGSVDHHGAIEVAPESGREHRCFVFKRGKFVESILDENCGLWVN
jgi:hypothetical protein